MNTRSLWLVINYWQQIIYPSQIMMTLEDLYVGVENHSSSYYFFKMAS